LRLTAGFDHEGYPDADDSLAYCLCEMLLTAPGQAAVEGIDADLALVLDVSGSMDQSNRYPLLCQAVRRLLAGLGPSDRVSITLFSNRAETVVPLLVGADAAEQANHIIASMNRSRLLFGPQTLLAPALGLALESLGRAAPEPGRVRRVYVLTDGEVHDTPACETALGYYRTRRTEVHVYGFGDEFNAAALKQLVSDQLGGTVKPICDEPDIVRTFAHLAQVNRRLAGQDGKLTVRFSPQVVCGDAWVFRPVGRYLGTIQGHRLEHVFGGLETGRSYSLLFECRLPVAEHSDRTPVAQLQASWLHGGRPIGRAIEVAARRVPSPASAGLLPAVGLVKRAFDALNALRHEDDPQAVLASLKARRELAVLEKRDPNLIAALDKMIASLEEAPEGQTVEQARAQLSGEEELYLDADDQSVSDFMCEEPPVEDDEDEA
jgi:hypothetical protein